MFIKKGNITQLLKIYNEDNSFKDYLNDDKYFYYGVYNKSIKIKGDNIDEKSKYILNIILNNWKKVDKENKKEIIPIIEDFKSKIVSDIEDIFKGLYKFDKDQGVLIKTDTNMIKTNNSGKDVISLNRFSIEELFEIAYDDRSYIGKPRYIDSVFLFKVYNFFYMIKKICKEKNIKNIELNGNKYKVDFILNLFWKNLLQSQLNGIHGNFATNTRDRINTLMLHLRYLTDFKITKQGNGHIIEVTNLDGTNYFDKTNNNSNISYKEVTTTLFTYFLSNYVFLDNWGKQQKIKNKSNKENKEYAKVWQTDNLRLLNQTDDILKTVLKKIKDDNVKQFIKKFKLIETDETTDLENLDKLLSTYYYIFNYIYERIFGQNQYGKIDNILGQITFKIRKLGQYKASGIYFPGSKVLSIDTRTWEALIHETGHFIHHLIAESKKDIIKKQKILDYLGEIRELLKPDTALYEYFAILKDERFVKLAIKEIRMGININIGGGYKKYGGTSKEIYARLFDKAFSYYLSKEKSNIGGVDINDIKQIIGLKKNDKDNDLYLLDSKIRGMLCMKYEITEEEFYNQFVDFNKNLINL